MLSFDLVPEYPCDVRNPMTSPLPTIHRACVYENGQRLLPTNCCGRYFPDEQVITDCGWCPDRWVSAYAADPVFHKHEARFDTILDDDDLPF